MSDPAKPTSGNIVDYCENLRATASFTWFLRRFITEPMVEADVVMRDLRKTPQEREDAVRLWNALHNVVEQFNDSYAVAKRKAAEGQ